MPSETIDALVVGTGFGGLGAALALAEAGQRVVVAERLGYPGGCASTFKRDGYAFESGATLFSGLGEGQLFRGWIERYGLDVEVDWIDPLVEFRCGEFELSVGRDRDALWSAFCEMDGADADAIRRFARRQRRVADTLWAALDDPGLLPPLRLSKLPAHVARLPRYASLLPLLGRPLLSTLKRDGLEGFRPLRLYLDALSQITLQTSSAEVEAPLALSTIDYYWRGTGHVRGGIGVLARALCDAIERQGGEVQLANRVRAIRKSPGGDGWEVETRRGTLRARRVIANLLPHDLARLAEGDGIERALAPWKERVDSGWGACMLYRAVRAPQGASSSAHHLQLVDDASAPLVEGNHVFASIAAEGEGGAAPGSRTMTVSTHVAARELEGLNGDAQGARVAKIQERMRETLRRRAPEWCEHIDYEAPASPRTFERFTGRHRGLVGGIPRRAGFAHYLRTGTIRPAPGLALVGDTGFPGQSILAAAIGGVRAAEA